MTEKEIVQALRLCGKIDSDCRACNLWCDDHCVEHSSGAAADLIERLIAENAALREKVPQWISVEDRLPEPGERVLVTDGAFVGEAYRTIGGAWRRYDGVLFQVCLGSDVTHWMPLPEGPKEEET